jgi:hypothetical protein
MWVKIKDSNADYHIHIRDIWYEYKKMYIYQTFYTRDKYYWLKIYKGIRSNGGLKGFGIQLYKDIKWEYDEL